jgi:hypothetical protein
MGSGMTSRPDPDQVPKADLFIVQHADIANELASEAVGAFIREHPSPNYNSPSATLREYLVYVVETAEDDYEPVDELWHASEMAA